MANTITRLNPSLTTTVYDSQARTADPNTMEFEAPFRVRALHLIIDATAIAATPSVVFNILGVDRLSAKTYTILASAAITGTGTTVLKVGPSLTASANVVANDYVPPVFRISAVHGDSDSITYTVGLNLIL